MIKNNNNSISSVYDETTCIGKIMKGVLKVYESWRKLLASGISPLTLLKSKGADLVDYKLYGNSVQEGIPTPETPIEIQSVGEKTKNLLNKDKAEEGYFINASGQKRATNSYGLKVTEPIPINPSKAYYYSGMGNVSGTTVTRTGYQYDENDNPIKAVNSSDGRTIYLEPEPNCAYVLLQYVATEEQPMFYEYGALSEEYEPYGYKIPIKAGSPNLIDYTKAEPRISSQKVVIDKENNAVIWSGNYYFEIPVNIKQGTTIFCNYESEQARVWTCVYEGNDRYSGNIQVGQSFVTPEKVIAIRIYKANSVGTVEENMVYKNIMLSYGDEVKPYVPYVEPITTNIYLNEPLRKIGDYADYIDFGKQKAFRNVQVIDNTGTLSIEESFNGVTDDTGTKIELSNIPTIKGTTMIEVDTKIQPSNVEVIYMGKP